MAFERLYLARHEPTLLKSPDGGVWNIAVSRRSETNLTRKDNPYTIAVQYEVTILETISQPKDDRDN